MAERLLIFFHGQAVRVREVPRLPFETFREVVTDETRKGARVVSFFGGAVSHGSATLWLVLAYDQDSRLGIVSTTVQDAFPSLTPNIPQVHVFEREIFEQWGVRPDGHPWLKPLRFHAAYPGPSSPGDQHDLLPAVTEFLKVSGDEIHEVAVGPVHAGIIEPGHFRFQCHGEHIYHLEIALGYQHRGVERALPGGPDQRTVHYMETLAGDTTVGHALAYAQALEGLADVAVPLRASALRSIMLELERLANHTGDLGALAHDVGYLPTSSYCGRLRGDFLNMTALICGNRFGRNMVSPGGVIFDLDGEMIKELEDRLEKTFTDVKNAVALLWDSALVMDRFDETGVVTKQQALDLGLVGVVARACGLERDVRFDFPTGMYQYAQIPVSTYLSGDVFARAFVRWLEIQRSFEFIRSQLQNLPHSEIAVTMPRLREDSLVVSLVEGWRGEICQVAMTDHRGQFAHYKITDPSFHNWTGLAMALRGEEISDFPLCNKSFNLSYCGHDL